MSSTASKVARISPAEAHEKMQHDRYAYVDVRRADEFAAGHPAGAIHVPIDDAFVGAMERLFAKDARIIVGCRTGVRSLRAAEALVAAGFTNVLEQRAGFEGARGPFGEVTEPGWAQLGLPRA